MPDTRVAKQRPKLRYYNIPVEVPPYATEDEVAEFEMKALYRAYRAAARRVGATPRPAIAVQPRAVVHRAAPVPAGPPSPVSARTVPEFLDCMRALRKWAKVSYGKLEQRAGKDADGALRLPHSTINRLLSKSNETKLPGATQLAAFVLACGLTEEQWREWSWVHGDIQSTGEGPVRFPALLDRTGRGGIRFGTNWAAELVPSIPVSSKFTIEGARFDGAASTFVWGSNASPATAAATTG